MIFNNINNKFLGIINLLIIIILLIFGLWPFQFWPKNEVEWLRDKNGVRVSELGIVYTPESLKGLFHNSIHNKAFTIEILLMPEGEPVYNISHILTVYDSSKTDNLIIAQYEYELIIRSANINSAYKMNYKEISIADALPKNVLRLITISSGHKGTFIYIDGKLTKTLPNYTLTAKDTEMPIQLILGNSSNGKNQWQGTITGLSVYAQQLSPHDVLKNYQSWTEKRYLQLSGIEGLVSLYVFNEKKARLVNDLSGFKNDLLIPETFKVFKKVVLEPPWHELHILQKIVSVPPRDELWISLLSLSDIAFNVIGFIPFGFLFLLCLWRIKGRLDYSTYLFTILAGGVISLLIEIIQVYMPSRSSSLSDLICNIMGTVLGAIILNISKKSLV